MEEKPPSYLVFTPAFPLAQPFFLPYTLPIKRTQGIYQILDTSRMMRDESEEMLEELLLLINEFFRKRRIVYGHDGRNNSR